MTLRNILATEKEKENKEEGEEEGDEKKKAGKISKKKRIRHQRKSDAHRKASQGYHHGDNQQLIRAGAILRLATLEAAASRL